MNLQTRTFGILIALAVCVGIGAGPAAAQTSDPIVVEVFDVHTPPTLDKLRANGVSVQASCSRDCLMQVAVKVTPAMASELGLSKRSIGFGARFAGGGRRVLVRAKIRPKAMDALENNQGGQFKIGVKGRDCSNGCVL
jgi:stringent starvation protein B